MLRAPKLSRCRVGIWQSIKANSHSRSRSTKVTNPTLDASVARLNIVAADGIRLLATTWGDTLSVLERADGVVLASESYDDDPAWRDIPDRHLVTVAAGQVTLTPLEGSA